MKKPVVLPVLLLLVAPLGAQTPPPARQPPAASRPSGTDAAVQEALKQAQAGDLGGAIQKLETLRKSPSVDPRLAGAFPVDRVGPRRDAHPQAGCSLGGVRGRQPCP